MNQVAKLFVLIIFTLQLNISTNANDRKEAAHLVNTINTTTDTLGKLEDAVSRHLNKLLMMAKSHNNYQPGSKDVDSLEYYYEKLISFYDRTTIKAYKLKGAGSSVKLKNHFLRLLKNGKAPWVKIIPAFLKGFRNGWPSLNQSEQNRIDSAGPIFRQANELTEQLLIIISEQKDILIKQFGLQYADGVYSSNWHPQRAGLWRMGQLPVV